MSAVAHFLGSSMPTASRIVAGLVQKGLIVRRGCADRRQVSLELTASGRALLEKAWVSVQAAMEAQLQHLQADERATLAAAMGLLRSIFGSAGLPARFAATALGGGVEIKPEGMTSGNAGSAKTGLPKFVK